MDRKEPSKERDSITSKETKILIVLTYSQSLSNISILLIKKTFKEIFQNEPVTAFKRNKNLKKLISSNKIEHNKVKKHNNIMKKGKCSLCSANDTLLRAGDLLINL